MDDIVFEGLDAPEIDSAELLSSILSNGEYLNIDMHVCHVLQCDDRWF